VEQLVNHNYTAGNHKIIWNASHLVSGIYFIRLRTSRETFLQKAVLLK
jgi:hypothetical protein